VLTGVGVDVSKFLGVRAGVGVLKRGAGAEPESENCDSAHLWWEVTSRGRQKAEFGLRMLFADAESKNLLYRQCERGVCFF